MSIPGIWLLDGLLRSLQSSHERGFLVVSLCDKVSDLTSLILATVKLHPANFW